MNQRAVRKVWHPGRAGRSVDRLLRFRSMAPSFRLRKAANLIDLNVGPTHRSSANCAARNRTSGWLTSCGIAAAKPRDVNYLDNWPYCVGLRTEQPVRLLVIHEVESHLRWRNGWQTGCARMPSDILPFRRRLRTTHPACITCEWLTGDSLWLTRKIGLMGPSLIYLKRPKGNLSRDREFSRGHSEGCE
jgi:hypothetical protein